MASYRNVYRWPFDPTFSATWHGLRDFNVTSLLCDQNAITVVHSPAMLPHAERVLVPADHPTFAGHFPGRPVLPGVVLLDMVATVMRRAMSSEAEVIQLRSVKFRSPILPGDELTIQIDGHEETLIQFRIVRGVELVTDGVMRVRKRRDHD
jgi:3-hydroxyacyl-[acyl-carrier-protein] dehydratase